jgi:hypothetical protein
MDPIVETVVRKYRERSDLGIQKYGKTLTRTDLDFGDWLTHLQEELMDATLYIERLKRDVNILRTTLPPEVLDRLRIQQVHNRVEGENTHSQQE